MQHFIFANEKIDVEIENDVINRTLETQIDRKKTMGVGDNFIIIIIVICNYGNTHDVKNGKKTNE